MTRRKLKPSARQRVKDPPWTPFEDITASMPPGFFDNILITENERKWFRAIYVNNRYQVMRFHVPVEGWPEGYVEWLNIKRRDRDWMHDWRELQRIKNELCGPEREAIEIYPAESRLVDTSNQYHLWVLAPDAALPFGYRFRAVLPPIPKGMLTGLHADSVQRPFEDPPENMTPAQDFAHAVGRYQEAGGGLIDEAMEERVMGRRSS